MNRFEERLAKEIGLLKQKHLWRSPSIIEATHGSSIVIEGRTYHNFSSNDYLGLSSHPALVEAATEACKRFGFGATASRLVCGTTRAHASLEEALAASKKTEAAMLFPSGFAAATGALSVLLERGDIILIDKLAHASLIDGARASEATMRTFRHNDLTQLEDRLRWARTTAPEGEIFIVTESVFSMDGDIAPLQEISILKERYGARLLVDEAHAVGLYGAPQERMGGLVGALQLQDQVDLHMGTLSKAMGAAGGYLCGSRLLLDFLRHRARSFIYTTAAPASLLAAAHAALSIIQSEEGEALATQLWKNIEIFTSLLSPQKILKPKSAIIPFILGEEKKAVHAAAALLEKGYFVPAIRYPTVARGTARLRFTMTANHSLKAISALATALLDQTFLEE